MSDQQNTMPGGWSAYTCQISSEAQAAFTEATSGLMGVQYSAVAVSQQVVAGMNYKFFCNATAVVENPFQYAAIVSIYKPLDGKATITGIFPIHD